MWKTRNGTKEQNHQPLIIHQICRFLRRCSRYNLFSFKNTKAVKTHKWTEVPFGRERPVCLGMWIKIPDSAGCWRKEQVNWDWRVVKEGTNERWLPNVALWQQQIAEADCGAGGCVKWNVNTLPFTAAAKSFLLNTFIHCTCLRLVLLASSRQQ